MRGGFEYFFEGEKDGEAGFDEVGDECYFWGGFEDGEQTRSSVFAVGSAGQPPLTVVRLVMLAILAMLVVWLSFRLWISFRQWVSFRLWVSFTLAVLWLWLSLSLSLALLLVL